MNDCKESYFSYLKTKKKVSDNTLSSYKNDILRFEEFLVQSSTSLIKATKTNVLDFVMSMQEKGQSSSTLMRKLASIRSFYGFLLKEKMLETDPTENIKNFKSEGKIPEILTGPEVEILLSQPKENTLLGYRDKALLELLYATGMRVTELINLNIEDVNIDVGYISCKSKGKTRVIPIYADAAKALKNYVLKARPLMTTVGDGTLFVNRNGTRLSRQGFWKIIKGYKESAKITKEITPHTLRHSFAVHLLENGADIKSIQEMLGHSNLSSMQVYNRIVKQRIKNVYYNAHPKAQKENINN